MPVNNWLVRGFELGDGTKVGKCLSKSDKWELYATSEKGFAIAVDCDLVAKWQQHDPVFETCFSVLSIGNKEIALCFDNEGGLISCLSSGPYPGNYDEALLFAECFKKSKDVFGENVSFDGALYIEKLNMVFPVYDEEKSASDDKVIGAWLTGGVDISTSNFSRLCTLLAWMRPSAVKNILQTAGLPAVQEEIRVSGIEPVSDEEDMARTFAGDRFVLHGRQKLEEFFNEHVIDIIANAEKYQRMGIGFPAAIILHGPPGCGKTFAVEKLVEFLGWPSYSVSSGNVGSPYIHDTSRKISEMFDTAIENAPSVLIIDEMESFLTNRETAQTSGTHHVEEVAEFLRRIPEATKKKVLIIAMTNMIDSIDPAILRRGRFDHILEVDMPSAEEVEALLGHLLSALPVADDVSVKTIAKELAGHPLSDVAYIVKEAGRLSVKLEKERIDAEAFNLAYKSLPQDGGTKRKIGFSFEDDKKE